MKNKKIKRYKNLLIAIFLLFIFALCLLVEPFATTVEDPSTSFKNVITAITLAAVYTLWISFIIYFLTRWINLKIEYPEMEVLHHKLINAYLLQERKNCREWCYYGNIGEYTRDIILPYLAEISNKKNERIVVNIHILDPLNEDICENYAMYKNSLSKKSDVISKEKIRQELITTILAAYHWKQKSNLDIQVYLKNNFSPVRIEMSDNMAIITRESPEAPAIVYRQNSVFYNIYQFDLAQSAEQDRSLDMNTPINLNNSLELDEIKNILKIKEGETKIDETLEKPEININLTNEELEGIKTLITKEKTPYRPNYSDYLRVFIINLGI